MIIGMRVLEDTRPIWLKYIRTKIDLKNNTVQIGLLHTEARSAKASSATTSPQGDTLPYRA